MPHKCLVAHAEVALWVGRRDVPLIAPENMRALPVNARTALRLRQLLVRGPWRRATGEDEKELLARRNRLARVVHDHLSCATRHRRRVGQSNYLNAILECRCAREWAGFAHEPRSRQPTPVAAIGDQFVRLDRAFTA